MFRGEEIKNLVTLLERRGVSLFHACQYADFCTYLTLGGIPSRALLEQSKEPFTAFATDAHDRQNGVWDKVFVNLADFGELFARRLQAVPNPYGPIVFQIRPSALVEADDVAICLRSAGAADFNRQREALRGIDRIEELFLQSSDAGFPRSTYLKSMAQLRLLHPDARVPEVSCSIRRGFIPLENVIVIWTDPYVLDGHSLIHWIKDAIKKVGFDFPIWERSCCEDRRELYAELLDALRQHSPTLRQLSEDVHRSPELRTWAVTILNRGLEYQFQRYQQYLKEGTLRSLIG